MDELERSEQLLQSAYIDPLKTTFVDLFEQVVENNGEKIAMLDHDHGLSYSALNADANRIAHRIVQVLGEGHEQVGLLLENGLPVVTGVWGGLKAVKVLVPLNSAAPLPHIETILQNTEIRLILTDDASYASALALQHNKPELGIININNLPANLLKTNPGLRVDPRDVYCIIHTSGSTGQPKGVMANQTNVMRHMIDVSDSGEYLSTHRMATFASFTFAAAFQQICKIMAVGGTMCYYDVKRLGTTGLEDWLNAVKPTLLRMRPTMLRSFARTLHAGTQFESVKTLTLGGEQSYRSDFDLFRQLFPSAQSLLTSLASTETWRMAYNVLTHASNPDDGPLPPARLYEQVKLTIVDENGEPQLPGVPGSITVEGGTTSCGYWGDPDNATTRFEMVDEARSIYRVWTNDRGVFHEDGTLEFLGRSDDHVKIRGYRVQLKAVEGAILQIPGVKNAAVVARNVLDLVLVAFYTTEDHQPLSIPVMRASLNEHVPDYMLPSHFVHLEDMPTTPGGKVDRQGLPDVDLRQRRLNTSYVAAATATERKLVKIFEELLGVEGIGVEDGFFDLGGTSLIAAQLMTRINDEFGVELPVVMLLRTNTVQHLSVMIEQPNQASRKLESQFVSLKSEGDRSPFVIIHGAEGDVMGSRVFLDRLGEGYPIAGIQAKRQDWQEMRRLSKQEVGERYAYMLWENMPRDSYILVGISIGGAYAYEMAQTLVRMNLVEPEAIMVVLLDTRESRYNQRGSHLMIRYGWRRRIITVLYKLFPGKRVWIRRRVRQSIGMYKRLLGKEQQGLYQDRTYQPEYFAGRVVYVQCTIGRGMVPKDEEGMKRELRPWRKVLGDQLSVIRVDSWHTKILWVPGAFEQFSMEFLPVLEAFESRR